MKLSQVGVGMDSNLVVMQDSQGAEDSEPKECLLVPTPNSFRHRQECAQTPQLHRVHRVQKAMDLESRGWIPHQTLSDVSENSPS